MLFTPFRLNPCEKPEALLGVIRLIEANGRHEYTMYLRQ